MFIVVPRLKHFAKSKTKRIVSFPNSEFRSVFISISFRCVDDETYNLIVLSFLFFRFDRFFSCHYNNGPAKRFIHQDQLRAIINFFFFFILYKSFRNRSFKKIRNNQISLSKNVTTIISVFNILRNFLVNLRNLASARNCFFFFLAIG